MTEIRIPMLALGPIPGLAAPRRSPRRLSDDRWTRRLSEAAAPYAAFARQQPDIELMATLPVRQARRVTARIGVIRHRATEAVRAGLAAATGSAPPDRTQITITITYDTATVHPHGDYALCLRKEHADD